MLSKAAEAKTRAEAIFKTKEHQAREAVKARAEYDAEARTVAERTARLRALHLAKEANEAHAKSS